MRTALRLALAAPAVCSFLVNDARAETVVNWRDPANWPAQVTAIQFGNQRLSANSSIRFGSWTVRFENNSSTIMRYAATPEMANVFAYGLVCSNSVVGTNGCGIYFGTGGSMHGKCRVAKNGLDSEYWSVDIPCPSSIDVTR
jgi:hypothetical protein